ncbi:MAG: hypothetical protein AB2L12_10115 [Smithellaceae bacterium]
MENKTNKLVLFCKSYDKDMLRARRMAESVQRFNGDNIPLYVSVPLSDLNMFKQCFGNIPCQFMTDEEILDKSYQVHGSLPRRFPSEYLQQLIKLEFWRMGFCENYVWLDSDSYFIKTFRIKDFFYDDNTPYTLQHDSKDLFDFADRIKNTKIKNDFEKLAIHFQKLFHRSGPLYNFGFSPLIWSCKVLESLYKDYLKPNSITIFDLLQEYHSEMQLYGEYLLFSKVIPVIPIDPLFKIYHYAEQFFEAQMNGESEFSLAENYLGVVIQSNWAKLPESKKPPIVRLKIFFNKMFRQLNQN